MPSSSSISPMSCTLSPSAIVTSTMSPGVAAGVAVGGFSWKKESGVSVICQMPTPTVTTTTRIPAAPMIRIC